LYKKRRQRETAVTAHLCENGAVVNDQEELGSDGDARSGSARGRAFTWASFLTSDVDVGGPLIAEELGSQGDVPSSDIVGGVVGVDRSDERQVDGRELLEEVRAIACGELRCAHRWPWVRENGRGVCGCRLRATTSSAAWDEHSALQGDVRRECRWNASRGRGWEVPGAVGSSMVDDELDESGRRNALIQTAVVADEEWIHSK
jgi:hypothetical protein